MNAKRKIEKALQENNMKVGRVWKGYSPFTMQNGWHRSNGQDWFMGRNVDDALFTIEALAEARADGLAEARADGLAEARAS